MYSVFLYFKIEIADVASVVKVYWGPSIDSFVSFHNIPLFSVLVVCLIAYEIENFALKRVPTIKMATPGTPGTPGEAEKSTSRRPKGTFITKYMVLT